MDRMLDGLYSNSNAILNNDDYDSDRVDVRKADTKIIPKKEELTRKTAQSDDRVTSISREMTVCMEQLVVGVQGRARKDWK